MGSPIRPVRLSRRLLTLQRIAAARGHLSASVYTGALPADRRKDPAGFEEEWARQGKTLGAEIGPLSASALDGVQPAAVRAVGEAALPQVREYYEASLEYGRNTMPESGFLYIGSALAQSVVREYGGRARFVVENYGDSALAKRFGVTRYPAIFVDDVLMATPKDFGFYGKGEGAGDGRYTPLKSAASHERFRADLSRTIDLILAGRKEAAREQAPSPKTAEIAALPSVTFTDVDGRTLSRDDLAGRVVLVEMWATWCPPCRGTLGWLGDVKKSYGDRIVVVTVAIQSEESEVRKIAADLTAPLVWVIGTPDLVRALGDVTATPTLLIFGPDGRTAGAFYGAPPTLHADAEASLRSLLG